MLYAIFEKHKKHSGIADRLKTVVHLYNISKANGYSFKLYWETPFKLCEYLKPKYDWVCSSEDFEYSIYDTRIISEVSWRKMPCLRPHKQYHCYRYSGNVLPALFEDTGYKWCELFNELFEPADILINAFNALGIENNYVAVHLRFVNALEKFENTYFDNHLDSEEERVKLIEKCKKGIQEIIQMNRGKDVYVISDSKKFLKSLSDISVKTLDSSNIGHVSENSDSNSQLKTFLDMLVMAKADKVYRIQSPELFKWSNFAVVAAKIGDIPLIDYEL